MAGLVQLTLLVSLLPFLTASSDSHIHTAQASLPWIRLKTAHIDVAVHPQRHERRGRSLQQQQLAAPTADQRWGALANAEQLLITLQSHASDEVMLAAVAALEENGAWVSHYIPDHTILAIGSDAAAAALRQVEGVVWVGEFAPEFKLAPEWQPLLARMEQDSLHSFLQQRHWPQNGTVGDLQPFLGALAADPVGSELRIIIEATFPIQRFGSGVRAWRENKRQLAVSVSTELLGEALSWLSHQPAVHWLAPRMQSRLHNWVASGIVQNSQDPPAAPVTFAQDGGSHPIWAAGLTGSGQVVGGGDSGVDVKNCYFNDPKVSFSSGLSTDFSSGIVSFQSTSHRKLVLYRELGDSTDNNGHGTHTMGTLTGNPADLSNVQDADYRGMAPDAKLAFIDLGNGRSDSIYTPQDLSSEYFPYTYKAGARVHSDSWGSSNTDYDFMASEIDLYTWDHQDFTSVFAAGNEGQSSATAGRMTVTSPATAKNCITAGASMTADQQLSASTSDFVVNTMTVSQGGDGAQQVEPLRVMKADIGGKVTTLYKNQYALTVADPLDGCQNPLNNAGQVSGTVVIMQRGNCLFRDKAQHAQDAGAAAVIIYDNQLNDYFQILSDGNSAAITLPVLSVPRRVGQFLTASSQSGSKPSVTFSDFTPPSQSFESLADFSSHGPTQDGRIKPDLVAPGMLLSAYTDPATSDTCSRRYMQGTSMATPVIAGSAALVRQYYTDGFYPTGVKSDANKFSPSGPLLKATLIGGAQGLAGFESDTGLPLAPPPSFRQGFGRVQLSRALPLKGNSLGWRLQVVDMANLTTGQTHSYCIKSTGGPLTVTLVWHDYPASTSAATALVNDLDLTVRAASLNGLPFLGNGGAEGGSVSADRLNNVEQVAISYLPAGQVAIEVSAHQVFAAEGPQPYALVVLGQFEGTLASPSNPVGGGTNTSGTCQIVVANITSGPLGLTNATSITYAFATQTGNGNGVSFECSLAPSASAANSSAAAWAACTSPKTYDNLADGSYYFSVRAQGEKTADSRAFTKDTVPPVAAFNSTLPGPQSAIDTATFAFQATDASSVDFQCMISAAPATLQSSINQWSSLAAIGGDSVQFGSWANCSSPQTYYGLLPGNWTLKVRATDAAGNTATSDLSANWTVAFAAGQVYTRAQSGPFALTASKNVSYVLQALMASSTGGVTPEANPSFDCQLVNQTGRLPPQSVSTASLSSSAATSASWKPCANPASFANVPDGVYTFLARVSAVDSPAADTQLSSTFTVDTTPPSVKVSSQPPAITSSKDSTLAFATADGDAKFGCLLSSAGNSSFGNSTYYACSSPVQYSSLPDGEYTFSLEARDRAGNVAAPVNVTWLVDTTPPNITALTYPMATRNSNISVSFDVTDGQYGSGVKGVDCRMRPGKLITNTTDPNDPKFDWQNCTSPAAYSGLGEGRWELSVRATDMAANTRDTGILDVYIDRTPPTNSISDGPNRNRTVPSTVIFTFQASSGGSVGSPIALTQCLLQPLTAQQFTDVQSGNTSALGFLGGSTPAISLSSVAQGVQLGSWMNCTSPATLKGIKSGNYSFQARATDDAGNQGAPTAPYGFMVDDTLPLDGASASGSGLHGWKLYAVIAGAAGAALLLLVCCVCCCSRRRRRQQQRAGIYRPQAHGSPHMVRVNGYDPAMAAAMQRSLIETRRTTTDDDSEQLRRALEASAEEQRIQKALERSLAEQRSAPRHPPARRSSDEEMRAALAASMEEQQLQVALRASMAEAATPTAPALDGHTQRVAYPQVRH
ncbi:hypothetical protein WJX72_011193 [[Myrmecia] bisecta]|uniref:Uncharacterized protein n=1 Tax=[Myrmecia] bisecta TaxID=41462 RepID=A0AAW1Q4U1_9CHLO